jgi:hypothetical protein
VYSHEYVTHAVRRDWWVLLTPGTASVAALLAPHAAELPVFDWAGDPSTPWYSLIQSLTTIVAFTYSLVMLFLNCTNRLLQYAQEAVLPFFMLHQPAIVIIAFFVDSGMPASH